MYKYALRRLLLFVPTILVVSIIIFVIMHILPGDVALMILQGGGTNVPTDEQLQEVRQELGLDRPLVVQYANWIKGWMTLDMGVSLWTNRSIAEEIARRFPVTLQLAVVTVLISVVVAVPLGVIGAVRQDTWIDHVTRLASVAGLSLPNFWLGTLIILALLLLFNWLPPYDFASLWEDPARSVQQLIFPALALGFHFMAIIARMTRSSMLEVLRQDYMRTAAAKGLTGRAIILRHALKNAMLPVITVAGIQLGTLLGGSVIVESIFVLPGVGAALVDAVRIRDWTLTQALIVVMAFSRVFVNLVVDLTYAWLDPRVQYQ